jgi:hypothetical protein
MVTPYCSTAQWAKRRGGYASFVAYTAAKGLVPNEDELQEILEDCTMIMNDDNHIGCLVTNITDSNYTDRLETICYNMSLRKLATERGINLLGGRWTWSPQDLMYASERETLIILSKKKKNRRVARVVF